MADNQVFEKLARLVRYYILYMTTKAQSGHATSALSAADIMTCLFFKFLRFDVLNPKNPANDRVIFSKGHASPLLYALWTAAGVIEEKELDSYRQLGSSLEGHPIPRFKYVDIASGSLGQGLSAGLGMAMGFQLSVPGYQLSDHGELVSQLTGQPKTGKLKSENRQQRTDNRTPKVYVLMGDSEVAEGSCWEAMEVASYYKVGNLVGIIDVNRLGQSTETMLGWDVDKYKRRVEAFGWQAYIIDGHNLPAIIETLEKIQKLTLVPQMIIAKTIKGKGVSFLEDKEGWHGVALKEDEFERAIGELGEVDRSIRGEIRKPESKVKSPAFVETSAGKQKLEVKSTNEDLKSNYKLGEMIATRKAYGETLTRLGKVNPRIVSLDGETSNSTYSEIFKGEIPARYFEMFIAEQNMVGVALGLSKMGLIPFVSTFAAFFTRAFDQVRMSAYSFANIKFVGSHAGVSIGQDGPSQMGLEDFAMFRAIQGSVIFQPAEAISAQRLVEIAAENDGIFYIRTQRPPTPVIYKNDQKFRIGGSNVVRSSRSDKVVIAACGIALIEAIKAADLLKKEGIDVRVVDAYCIKPVDKKELRRSAHEAGGKIITCEDHYLEGGLGDAVLEALSTESNTKVYKMGISRIPTSGKGEDLLSYEGIDAKSIAGKVKDILE